MKDIFKDLIETEGVCGIIVLDAAGALITSRFSDLHLNLKAMVERFGWEPLILELDEFMESDFVFDKKRFYIRKLKNAYLIVIMDDIASISMVRLNCEILLPELAALNNTGSRFGRMLKKKIF